MRARQAAEALFTPKPETQQSVSEPSQAPDRRKPILPTAPIRQKIVDGPVSPEPLASPEIPVKKLTRLRTLVKYGMSISQVADLYRVPVETIEQILRKT